jgi:hypothetical protein
VSGALTLLSFAEGNTEGVSGKDRATAERIAVLLGANHRAVGWVLGGCAGKFMNDLLDDRATRSGGHRGLGLRCSAANVTEDRPPAHFVQAKERRSRAASPISSFAGAQS